MLLLYTWLEIFFVYFNIDHLICQWYLYKYKEALLFVLIKIKQEHAFVSIKKISIHWIGQPSFNES